MPKQYIAYVVGEKEDYEEEGDEEEDADADEEEDEEESENDEEESEEEVPVKGKKRYVEEVTEREVEPYEDEDAWEEEDVDAEEPLPPPPKSKKQEFKVIKEEEWTHADVPRKTSPYASWYELAALITSRAVQLTSPGNLPLIDPGENFAPESIAKREVQNMIRKRAEGAKNPKEWTVMLGIERKLLDETIDFYRADELIYPRGFAEDP